MRDVKFTCGKTQNKCRRLALRVIYLSRGVGARPRLSSSTAKRRVRTHLRRLEGIVRGEVDVQEENTTGVRAVRLRGPRQRTRSATRLRLASSRRKTGAREGCEPRTGPMIVACQWKRSSPFGPALQLDGGSRLISANSCAEIHARGDYTQIGAWPCRARGGGGGGNHRWRGKPLLAHGPRRSGSTTSSSSHSDRRATRGRASRRTLLIRRSAIASTRAQGLWCGCSEGPRLFSTS